MALDMRNVSVTQAPSNGSVFDDNYLYCYWCDKDHLGHCRNHGPMKRFQDVAVADDDPMKALHSLPTGLIIGQSCLPGASLGVWAGIDLDVGTVFGPYIGKIVEMNSIEALTSDLCWQIHGPTEPLYCIDGKDVASSNWMRYVNCASSPLQQNLTAFQYMKHIFYRTIKPIPKGSELFVWHGRSSISMTESTQQCTIDVPRQMKSTTNADLVAPNVSPAHVAIGTRACTTPSNSPPANMLPADTSKQISKRGQKCQHSVSSDGEYRENIDRENKMQKKPIVFELPPNIAEHASGMKAKNGSRKSPVATKNSSNMYSCTRCIYTSNFSNNIRMHERAVHKIRTVYECSQCLVQHHRVRDLRQHLTETGHQGIEHRAIQIAKAEPELPIMNGSPGEDPQPGGVEKSQEKEQQLFKTSPPNECHICAIKFLRNFYLTRHLREVHQLETRYKCSSCQLICNTLHALWDHQTSLEHAGTEKDYTGVERKSNSTKLSKRPPRDQLVSTNLRNCYVNLSRVTIEALAVHGRKHKCQDCSTSFRRSSHLKYHCHAIAVERFDQSPSRKQQCYMCAAVFRRSDEVKHHLIVKHAIKTSYICLQCLQKYANYSDLSAHQKGLKHSGVDELFCPLSKS